MVLLTEPGRLEPAAGCSLSGVTDGGVKQSLHGFKQLIGGEDREKGGGGGGEGQRSDMEKEEKITNVI